MTKITKKDHSLLKKTTGLLKKTNVTKITKKDHCLLKKTTVLLLMGKNDPAGNIMNASPVAWLHNSGRQRKGRSCGMLTKLGQSG